MTRWIALWLHAKPSPSKTPLGRFATQPAYEMFAQACGGHGEVVRSPQALPAALRRALRVVREEKRQALVNVDCGNVRGFGVH